MTTIHATLERRTNGLSVVQTAQGAVRGLWENDVAVFRGIPYAEPPVGKLRFRPPVRRGRWDGVRDATRFGEIVPQTDESALDAASLPKDVPQGDDCLNLNVWTPTLENAIEPPLPPQYAMRGAKSRPPSGICGSRSTYVVRLRAEQMDSRTL